MSSSSRSSRRDRSTKSSSSNRNETVASSNGDNCTLDATQKDKINKLESITGLSRDEAKQLLEAFNYNLEAAIEVQFGTTSTSGVTSKISNTTDDEVRAPIPQKSEKLIDYNPYAVTRPQKRTRSVFDGFRDLKSESDELESPQLSKKRNTLAQLFRPPLDLIFTGTFESAKKLGSKQSKWLLVDVQNTEEFDCQILNRDLWSDTTVKEIIKANFIFLQTYFDTEEGHRLVSCYKITQYPFVAIIDPRTGEKMKSWNKLDTHLFCENITNFLADNELPADDDFATNDVSDENGNNQFSSQESFTNKIKQLKTNGDTTPKKLTSEQATRELLNNIKVNEDLSSSSSSSDDDNEPAVQPKPVPVNEEPQSIPKLSGPPKIIKYETQTNDKKDCTLRIMCPNGDRIDFLANGDTLFKLLVEYLHTQGYRSTKYELIERLLPNEQKPSRNLLNINLKQTFKQLNLYPRVFLLLQEL